MKTTAIDEFGTKASEAAMRGAIAFLVPAGTRPNWTEAQVERLLSLIREETISALPGAIADAKRAVECGMGGYASTTFVASMALAGTRAAKRWSS